MTSQMASVVSQMASLQEEFRSFKADNSSCVDEIQSKVDDNHEESTNKIRILADSLANLRDFTRPGQFNGWNETRFRRGESGTSPGYSAPPSFTSYYGCSRTNHHELHISKCPSALSSSNPRCPMVSTKHTSQVQNLKPVQHFSLWFFKKILTGRVLDTTWPNSFQWSKVPLP